MSDASEEKASPLVTVLLKSAEGQEPLASEELLPVVYDELRQLARWRMAGEPAGHTLQPTALVHEAYMRLLGRGGARWENRRHFFAAAAEAMRRILIERARRYRRHKHGGEYQRIDFEEIEGVLKSDGEVEDFLALDDALTRLEARDPQRAQVVKLRHFAGFSIREVADALDLSTRTVNRQWTSARAWLRRELGGRSTRRSEAEQE